MKAGVIYNTGDIRYDDFPDPTCGADDIIVRVAACGICGSDSPRILSGWKYPLPGVPGHEFSGTVVEIGKNVKKFHVGENVAVQPFIPCNVCDNCRAGYVSMCDGAQMIGADMPGGYAEYCRVPATNAVVIGDVNLIEAALLEPCAVSLYGVLGIQPVLGDTVAVLGCGTIGQSYYCSRYFID